MHHLSPNLFCLDLVESKIPNEKVHNSFLKLFSFGKNVVKEGGKDRGEACQRNEQAWGEFGPKINRRQSQTRFARRTSPRRTGKGAPYSYFIF